MRRSARTAARRCRSRRRAGGRRPGGRSAPGRAARPARWTSRLSSSMSSAASVMVSASARSRSPSTPCSHCRGSPMPRWSRAVSSRAATSGKTAAPPRSSASRYSSVLGCPPTRAWARCCPAGRQRVEGGQPPDQLAGLGQRQRPQVMPGQPPACPAGQGERVAAGDQQPGPRRRLHPGGQEPRQVRISDLPAAGAAGEQVLGVVGQQQHRQPGQHHPADQLQPVPPRRARIGQRGGDLTQRVLAVQAVLERVRQQRGPQLLR